MKIADLFNVEGYGVVVTGGASGIGLGYAEALAAKGARVTILDVHAQRVEDRNRSTVRAPGWTFAGKSSM